jgi:hypothetical protein
MAYRQELIDAFGQNRADELASGTDVITQSPYYGIGCRTILDRGSALEISCTTQSICAPLCPPSAGYLLTQNETIPESYFYTSKCAHTYKLCNFGNHTKKCELQWWLFPDAPGSKRFEAVTNSDNK